MYEREVDRGRTGQRGLSEEFRVSNHKRGGPGVGEEPSNQPGRWWGCLGSGLPKRPPALVTGLKGAGLRSPLGVCWLSAGPCRKRGGGPRGVSSTAVVGRGGVTIDGSWRGSGDAGGARPGAPSSAWSISSPEGGAEVGSLMGVGRDGQFWSR